MSPHEFPVASQLRPASFHPFSSTWVITNGALNVSPLRWSYNASSCYCFRLRECRCKWKRLVRSCSTSEFVVASDENYGNKQVVSLTPRLYEYVLKNVREPEILRQLRGETASMRGSQMQVSPDQAQLLAMLVQILGAERCIEVGVYTGYSSLAIALVLPESGRLVACERDAKSLDVAKKYYQLAGVSHKVDAKLGLAMDCLESLILNGEAGSYDFAFIDAEKKMNEKYFELLLQLVRVGGLIVIDNVLWHGKVADPLVNKFFCVFLYFQLNELDLMYYPQVYDPKTISIRNFNQKLMEDKRVSISMVPIGDGMTICRKR
uniref:Caffeoyl-CoA O-methyltransferase At4g26220 family n=1 Tax=Cajanus cajan TaxID=3821 RepID=A0A151SW36_CAJCA|nr:putative caffeoyl-CoA O-methyltransferase At4g26220 family [Cajanus cajan]